jgi:hypothetical protein
MILSFSHRFRRGGQQCSYFSRLIDMWLMFHHFSYVAFVDKEVIFSHALSATLLRHASAREICWAAFLKDISMAIDLFVPNATNLRDLPLR